MVRWITFGSALCILMARPGDLLGQFNHAGKRFDPNEIGLDPRVRRAWREKAVAVVGPDAREFVETQGDVAVAAIFACSRPVAVKLVQFYSSGDLDGLPRPTDLLRAIAQPGNGDDVALWAMRHADELSDADSFDAFNRSPLDYALGLKQLAVGTAEVRAWRLNQAAMKTTPSAVPLSHDQKMGIAAAAGLAIIGFLIWRRRNSAIY